MSQHLQMIELLGALTGALGVIIAIYLQLIVSRYCPPRYVTVFLVFGISMIMMHSGPFNLLPEITATLRIIAYSLLIILQLSSTYYIWKNLECDNPIKDIVGAFSSDDNL